MKETATVVRSRISRRLMILVALVVFLLVWLFVDIYLYTNSEAALFIEIAALVVIIVYVLRSMLRNCLYRLDHNQLEFVQYSWRGKKLAASISLDDVVALYRGRPRRFGPLRCKDTVLVHAVLDSSDMWALIYRLPADAGDAAFRRVFFKPGETLLAKLRDRLPGKHYGSEEEAFLNIDF
ncbi:MAG: hypothetical protein N3A57_01900 [Negativicutes bacterium]|nr:hypothetical protein [Negativicutes bacterium]